MQPVYFHDPTMPSIDTNPRTVRPINDNVILAPDLIKKSGLIHLPNQLRVLFATVIAVGPGKLVDGVRRPMAFKPGDRVVFSDEAHFERRYEMETFLFLTEEHVLAIIEEE